jgi:hypothetical protein
LRFGLVDESASTDEAYAITDEEIKSIMAGNGLT